MSFLFEMQNGLAWNKSNAGRFFTSLIAKREMDRLGRGAFQVLVDTAAARDNITRLAKNQKWEVSIEQKDEEFLLTLKK